MDKNSKNDDPSQNYTIYNKNLIQVINESYVKLHMNMPEDSLIQSGQSSLVFLILTLTMFFIFICLVLIYKYQSISLDFLYRKLNFKSEKRFYKYFDVNMKEKKIIL